jgi:hypothetical protein
MLRQIRVSIHGLILLAFAAQGLASDKVEFFEKKIRPLLLEKCVACHGPEKAKGGLRLDTKDGWQRGGDSGAVIVAREPERSLLIQAVQQSGDLKMPPKGKLPETEIAALVQWVKDGAIDPRDAGPVRIGNVPLADAKKWWAFQPIRRPDVPNSPFKNPIDAFIVAKLHEKNQSLAPPADKRTLLRRITYDLTGLPPTWEELIAFEKDDSPLAFTRVVDRLLASPQYGERWGRHWLDLVRYADTAGDNSDHPLPHAWRYRNWVIAAFNTDQPYDEFVRDQIAGDIIGASGPPEQYAPRVIATGFLSLARRFEHDSDKAMHLTHEDGIDTLGKSLLGLTLGCARCHDHKYDAISTRDYYALYGILDSSKFSFAGCEAKQQPRDLVPLVPPNEWNGIVKPFQENLKQLDAEIAKQTEAQLHHAKAILKGFESARKRLSTGEIADAGEQAFPESEIEVKLGEVVFLSITPLKNHGADTTLLEFDISEVGGESRKWNATTDLVDDLLASNPHSDQYRNRQVWWLVDTRNQPLSLPEAVRDVNGKTGLHAWRNGDTPSVLVNSTETEIAAWTKLPARSLFVHPAPNGNVGLVWVSPISGKVKITGRIKDAHPGGPDGVGWVLEHFAVDVRTELSSLSNATEIRADRERQKTELLRNSPRQDLAFAVIEGTPADAKIQIKGDPEKLGDPVPRRWLEVLGGQRIQSPSSSGRLDLASWITAKENPLTARVMVNRIWLHHFGKGLVPSPNDFGTRGVPPTYPELLDWLASEFIASGWSIKAMHRKIVLSQTYQQSTSPREGIGFERRRLSAEELRDSLLRSSGQLNLTPAMGHPFPPESSWSYSQHVPFSTFFETDRRSAYLISVRNRRHPFLGLFDGADPNATTPVREATTVPTQALYFMNSPFFHAQAEQLVNRLFAQPEGERLNLLFRLTLQRDPAPRDQEFAKRFLSKYLQGRSDPASQKTAWAALARIILASNEFLFVE